MSRFDEAVQAAIFAQISTDTVLQDMGVQVYDNPPDNASYPLIQLADMRSEDWAFQGAIGANIRMQIAIYSRYAGKHELHAIAVRIEQLLHAQNITASGVQIVQIRTAQMQIDLLPDARTQRGRMQLEIYAHE